MRNLLGIDFFRVVSEPCSGDWSQVFAKIPFDEEEIFDKGGVWGVLRLRDGKEAMEKGSELLSELEEKYNSVEAGNLLEHLMEVVGKYGKEIELVLLEIGLERSGERSLRVRGTEGSFVVIVRGGRRVSLVGQGSYGQVVRGNLEKGDRLLVGVGKMRELVEREEFDWVGGNLGVQIELLSTEVMAGEWGESMAGLFLECGEVDVLESEEDQEEVEVKRGGDEVTKEDVLEKEEADDKSKMGWRNRLFPQKGAGVEMRLGRVEKKRRWAVFSGLVFLGLMLVTVVGGYWKTKGDEEKKEFNSVYEVLDKKRRDAVELAKINPGGAVEMLTQVRGEVGEKRETYLNTEWNDSWKQLEFNIDEDWKKITGEYKVEPELFFDLSLVRDDFDGGAMTGDEEGVLVLDKEAGVVIRLTYAQKKAEVVAGKGEGKGWRSVVWFKNKVVVVKSGELLFGEEVFEQEAKLADPVAVEKFGEAMYMLDRATGEVWRFVISGGELSSGQRWLKGEEVVELREGVAMVIDSDVWVVTEKGEVIRLRRGVRENFELVGVPGEVKIGSMAVGEENLVLLDKQGGRLLVFDKEGNYLKQLSWEGLSKAEGVVFRDGGLMVLVGSKLFEVKI